MAPSRLRFSQSIFLPSIFLGYLRRRKLLTLRVSDQFDPNDQFYCESAVTTKPPMEKLILIDAAVTASSLALDGTRQHYLPLNRQLLLGNRLVDIRAHPFNFAALRVILGILVA